MEPMNPTPPVSDVPWQGEERRRVPSVQAAVESAVAKVAAGPKATPDQSDRVERLVAIGVIIAFQLITMINQFSLAHRLNSSEKSQQEFRDSVGCFLIETFKAELTPAGRAEILSDCGFIKTPGNGRR